MQKFKPIVKWVIGPCHKLGFEVLRMSVKKFRHLYKDKFKYVLCYNQLSSEQIDLLPLNLIDELVDQSSYIRSLGLPVPNDELTGPAWKLYPPRLFPECHELLIDNDLIVYRQVPEIEKFLYSQDLCIITEAYRRSYQGKFEHLVRNNFTVNSGFVGLPPYFDYASKIREAIRSVEDESKMHWETHFEEQSIVALVLQEQKTNIIPLHTIQVNGEEMGNKIGACGTHFIGTNKGFYHFWNQFKTTIFY